MLIPSAPEWFELCDAMQIPAESLRSGILDSKTPATLRSEPREGGFRLPKRYIEARGTSIRAIMPLLAHAEKTLGEQRLNAAIENMGLDPDISVELSNVLNVNFCMDLARLLLNEGAMKLNNLSVLDPHIVHHNNHGALHQDYSTLSSAEGLLSKWHENLPYYCSNFQYAIEEQDAHHLVLSAKAREHMKTFQYLNDPVLGDFQCRYFARKIATIPTYNGGAEAKVESLACHHKGDDRCIYRVSLGIASAA